VVDFVHERGRVHKVIDASARWMILVEEADDRQSSGMVSYGPQVPVALNEATVRGRRRAGC
jgi:hypothetical protein